MLGNFPPFTTMQELNLDWILTKIKNILRFVPDDGAVGQILRRTRSGAEWSDEQGAGGSVTSVNGMQGAVVLGAADVGALPDTYVAPVTSVNGQTGDVVLTIPDSTSDLVNDAGFVNAAGAAAAAPVQSVNGQTGAVSLTIPDSTSDLVNDAGFVNTAGAAAAAPVQSVNGQTGAVSLSIPSISTAQCSDVGLGFTYYTNQLTKYGPFVFLTIKATRSATLPEYPAVLFNVPAGFRPINTTDLISYLYDPAPGIPNFCEISSNGDITLRYGVSASGKKEIDITTMWSVE